MDVRIPHKFWTQNSHSLTSAPVIGQSRSLGRSRAKGEDKDSSLLIEKVACILQERSDDGPLFRHSYRAFPLAAVVWTLPHTKYIHPLPKSSKSNHNIGLKTQCLGICIRHDGRWGSLIWRPVNERDKFSLSMVVHTCNPNTWEVKVRGSGMQCWPWLHVNIRPTQAVWNPILTSRWGG